MCASVTKAELALNVGPLEGVDSPASVETSETQIPARRDALQALLAFAALHGQVLQRRSVTVATAAPDAKESSILQFLLEEVLELVAQRAVAITGADGIGIALAEGQQIVCRASAGSMAPDRGVRLDPNSGFSGACLRSGEVMRCDDVHSDSRVNVQACLRLGTQSMLAVPLRARGRVVGIIEAFSRDAYAFNDADVRSLVLLAELILGAIKPEEQERIRRAAERATAADSDNAEALISSPEVNPPVADETRVELALAEKHDGSSATEVLACLEEANKREEERKAADAEPSAPLDSSDIILSPAESVLTEEEQECHSVVEPEREGTAVAETSAAVEVTSRARSEKAVQTDTAESVKESLAAAEISTSQTSRSAEDPPNTSEVVPIFQAGMIFGLDSDGKKTASASVVAEPVAKDSEESPSPGLSVVAAIVIVAVMLSGGLWWMLNSDSQKLARTSSQGDVAAKSSAQSGKAADRTLAAQQATAALADLASSEVGEDSGDITPEQVENAKPGVIPRVTAIRHWSSAEGSTVVIDLQDQVNYEAHRLASPDRIYVDLHDTNLAADLTGKTIDIGDPVLKRVRVAQPTTGISRIVLDTNPDTSFSVSLEPNPYRLVLQVKGGEGAAAKVASPAASNNQAQGQKPTSAQNEAVANSSKKQNIAVMHSLGREALSTHPGSASPDDAQLRGHVPKFKIVVDAGHGGWDLGTVGRKGLLEKDLVLDIAQRLGKLLEGRLGSDVVYTRKEDNYVALDQRAELANEAQADLFVSIHANYSDLPSARGVETYYTNLFTPPGTRENAADNGTLKKASAIPALSHLELKDKIEQSRKLAATVQRSLFSTLAEQSPSIRNRGVKEASYVVLTGTAMPSILAEVSFVSSPADETNLQHEEYRQRIAEALYRGIARYAASSHRVKMASAERRPTGE